jgi:hypothetical protein
MTDNWIGDACTTENDCDSNWVCTNRRCSVAEEDYTDEYYEPDVPQGNPRVSTVYYTVWPRATPAP